MNILIKLGNLLLKFLYNNVFKNYATMVLTIPFIVSLFTSKIDRNYRKQKEEGKKYKEDVLKIKERYKGVPEQQLNQKIEEYYQSVGFDPIPALIKKIIATMIRISIVISLINPDKFLTQSQIDAPNPFLGFPNVIVDEMSISNLMIYVIITVLLTLLNIMIDNNKKISDVKMNKEFAAMITTISLSTLAISSLLYWIFTKNVSFHLYSISLTLGNTASLIIRNMKIKKGGDLNE